MRNLYVKFCGEGPTNWQQSMIHLIIGDQHMFLMITIFCYSELKDVLALVFFDYIFQLKLCFQVTIRVINVISD